MLKKSLTILLVVGVLALVFPLMVAARGGQPPADAPRYSEGTTVTGTQRRGWLTGGVSLVDAVAQATGMSVEDVVAALESGKTFSDLVSEAGVTLQAVVDVMLDARAAALEQAVTDGRMTQEQVDTMLAQMAEDLLAQLNTSWSAQGAGNGYRLDGTQPQDGSGYRGSRGMRGAGRGTMQGERPMGGTGDCLLPES